MVGTSLVKNLRLAGINPMSQIVNCLRCGTPCRTGTPDPTKRAILAAAKEGFCSNCMIEHFLLSIEPIANIINGTPSRGHKEFLVPGRPGRGPELFLDAEWRERVLRPVLRGVLAFTQMPEDSINWIEVVGNWGLPWPKGKQPKLM
jgi:hypothetical protein